MSTEQPPGLDPSLVSVDRKRSRPAAESPASACGSEGAHAVLTAPPPTAEIVQLLQTLTTGMSELGGHMTGMRSDLCALTTKLDSERVAREADMRNLRAELAEEREHRTATQQHVQSEIQALQEGTPRASYPGSQREAPHGRGA